MREPILMEPLPRVTASRPCPITGSSESCVVTETDRHSKPLRNIVNCQSALVYVDPIPIEDLRNFYTQEYRKEYKASPAPSKRRVLRAGRSALTRFRRIQPHLSARTSPRSLDVGASSGEFVCLLTEAGFAAKGCEPNESFARFARETLKVDVVQGMVADLALEPSSLDLITLFHVVEHLEDPVATLRQFRGALKPDGLLVVEVPNILSANMGFRHKWHKGHLFGFSRQTLAACAQLAGFTVLEIDATGQDHNVWIVCKPSRESALAQEALARQTVHGHFDAAVRALRENASARYLLQVRPWVAAARRTTRSVAELRAFALGNPRDMLRALYRQGLALQSVQ